MTTETETVIQLPSDEEAREARYWIDGANNVARTSMLEVMLAILGGIVIVIVATIIYYSTATEQPRAASDADIVALIDETANDLKERLTEAEARALLDSLVGGNADNQRTLETIANENIRSMQP